MRNLKLRRSELPQNPWNPIEAPFERTAKEQCGARVGFHVFWGEYKSTGRSTSGPGSTGPLKAGHLKNPKGEEFS